MGNVPADFPTIHSHRATAWMLVLESVMKEPSNVAETPCFLFLPRTQTRQSLV